MFFEKSTQGYQTFSDGTRMCSYQICLTEDEFAGIPIQIIQVDEYYSKRKKDLQVHFFAVCTDFELLILKIKEKSGSGRASAREENNLEKHPINLHGKLF